MTNATSNSKGHANLVPHYNAWLKWLHLRWVSSSAINLCYGAGHRARPLSQAFPRKQLCELAKWWANATSAIPLQCEDQQLPTPTPQPLPALCQPPPFRGSLREEADVGADPPKQTLGLPTPPMPEGSWAPQSSQCHLLNTWPLHAGDATFPQLPEELARRRLKIWKCAVSSCFKIAKLAVASQPSNTYLSCHTQVHSSPATC